MADQREVFSIAPGLISCGFGVETQLRSVWAWNKHRQPLQKRAKPKFEGDLPKSSCPRARSIRMALPAPIELPGMLSILKTLRTEWIFFRFEGIPSPDGAGLARVSDVRAVVPVRKADLVECDGV